MRRDAYPWGDHVASRHTPASLFLRTDNPPLLRTTAASTSSPSAPSGASASPTPWTTADGTPGPHAVSGLSGSPPRAMNLNLWVVLRDPLGHPTVPCCDELQRGLPHTSSRMASQGYAGFSYSGHAAGDASPDL